MESDIQVLHLDTDTEFLQLSAELLETENDRLSVTTTQQPAAALERLDGIDCIVTEFALPTMNGIEFLETVRDQNRTVPVILFTGTGSEEIASDAISAGVTDYIQKGGIEQFTILANRIVRAVEAHIAQSRVQRREREYQQLVDSAPVPIFVLDSDAQLLYLNSAGAAVLSIDDTDTVIGENAFQFIPESEEERGKERLGHVFTEREPVEPREYPVIDPDGETRYVRGNIVPVTFDGELAAQLVAVDITDQKRRRIQLERYRTAVEAGGDAIYALDEDGYIQMVNERHVEFAGVEREELIGSHPSEFLEGEVIDKAVETVHELLDNDEQYGSYTFKRDIDGETRFYENTVSLIREDGEFTGTVGIIRDITGRRRTQQKLERQNKRLDKFASVISHDLRNPLNVAQLRLDLEQQDTESEHLDAVENAHDRMEALTEDLLQLTRHGQSVADPERVHLSDLVETCWQTTVTGDATLQVETDLTIMADETRLRRLFENLFRNSVEHGRPSADEHATDSGGEMSVDDGASESVSITVGDLADGFYIADDGAGISEEMVDELFEYGSSSSDEGTGFGLAIVREIVEAHEWTISVTDSESGGARFEISDVTVVGDP